MSDVCITKEVEFDAGHRIPNHRSKCKNPHGHRYRVVAHCVGPIIEEEGHPEEGMLVDFGDLKAMLMHFHDAFDHGFIVYEGDHLMLRMFESPNIVHDVTGTLLPRDKKDQVHFKVIKFPYIPTAENIARYVYENMVEKVADEFGNHLTLDHITVYETPTSRAIYPALRNHL